MGERKERDSQELERLYPEGSIERHVLEYSQAGRPFEALPPSLVKAGKVFIGGILVVAVAFSILVLATR